MRQWLARVAARFKQSVAAGLRLIGSGIGAIGGREVALIVGLSLIGYGLSLVYWPAAFIVPGAILVAVAIFGVS